MLLIVDFFVDVFHLVNLLGETGCWFGVDNVVLVIEYFNLILARDYITLVNVDQVALLISGQDDLIVDVEVSVLHDVLDVLRSLDVVLAPVGVDANVTHFLVLGLQVVLLSYLVVVLVVVVDVWVGAVLMPLSQLEDDFVLLGYVFVVGVYQHVLVIVGHVEVLVNFLVRLGD